MKFLPVLILVLCLTTIASAGLAGILSPLLHTLQPLTNGVEHGVSRGAKYVSKGVSQVGEAVHTVTQGAGKIASGTLLGTGRTAAKLPGGVFYTVHNLDKSGLVGNLQETLLGESSSFSHSNYWY